VKKLLILATLLALLAVLAIPMAAFAYTNTGTTNVNGSIIAPSITIAPPTAIDFGTLKVGVNEKNSDATGSVLVAVGSANSGNWQVTAASDPWYGGYMYNGSNNLAQKMWIATVDGYVYADTGSSYTGTFDNVGACTPSPFTLYAHQDVLNTDPAGYYGIVIVFTASITSYN
jgi:hypothetical protein